MSRLSSDAGDEDLLVLDDVLTKSRQVANVTGLTGLGIGRMSMPRKCGYMVACSVVTSLIIILLSDFMDVRTAIELTLNSRRTAESYGPQKAITPLYVESLIKVGATPCPYQNIAETSSGNVAASNLNAEIATCRFPHLLVDDPVIQPFLKHYSKLSCAEDANWVYTENGTFYISSEAEAKHGKIKCNYLQIYRKDDDHWDYIERGEYENGTALPDDMFHVKCKSSQGHKYDNIHAGVALHPELLNRTDSVKTPRLNMDVYIYLLDSMSRINFIRKLPLFYKVLTEEMDSVVMEGFNVVGDGTPWTMIPVTTGKFQTELYEGRKRFTNSSQLDGWPLIFKDYKAAGYVTSYIEEQPQFSFFSYKLRGFKDPPVDHYLRPFAQAVNYVYKKHKPYCLGDTPRSIIICNWWKEQQDIYSPKNIRTFSMLFSSETSHDDYNYVQVLDEHLEAKFREQFRAGSFNNSIVVVMGDHGRRFGEVRQTQSGKTEEKLPFLSITVPDWFQSVYPESWKNLKTNGGRLVTPFDIYETLKAVINFKQDGGKGSVRNRGISLFQEIPSNRTCKDAWIKPHFCSCLEWEEMTVTAEPVQKAMKFVLAQFNKLLLDAHNACLPLSIDRVVNARRLHPNENLLAFKESADYDNISPDLTASKSISYYSYQIRFITKPNGGDYEISINHYLDNDRYSFSVESDVSRINMYGNQPHCIMDSLHHLRQYCYCADLLTNANATYGEFVPIAGAGT